MKLDRFNTLLLRTESCKCTQIERILELNNVINLVGVFSNINLLVSVIKYLNINLIAIAGETCSNEKAILKNELTKYKSDCKIIELIRDDDRSLIVIDDVRNSKHTSSRVKFDEFLTMSISESFQSILEIKLFGKVFIGYKGLEKISLRAKKTEELFLFLLHNNKKMTRDTLIENLWRGYDYEVATRQLYNNIYNIRKALKDYGINRGEILIDSEYRAIIGDANFDLKNLEYVRLNIDNFSYKELVDFSNRYEGEYLEGYDYEWLLNEKQQVNNSLVDIFMLVAEQSLEREDYVNHEAALLKAFQLDPHFNKITDMLLNYYLQTSQKSKALRHYQIYNEYLKQNDEFTEFYDNV